MARICVFVQLQLDVWGHTRPPPPGVPAYFVCCCFSSSFFRKTSGENIKLQTLAKPPQGVRVRTPDPRSELQRLLFPMVRRQDSEFGSSEGASLGVLFGAADLVEFATTVNDSVLSCQWISKGTGLSGCIASKPHLTAFQAALAWIEFAAKSAFAGQTPVAKSCSSSWWPRFCRPGARPPCPPNVSISRGSKGN